MRRKFFALSYFLFFSNFFCLGRVRSLNGPLAVLINILKSVCQEWHFLTLTICKVEAVLSFISCS